MFCLGISNTPEEEKNLQLVTDETGIVDPTSKFQTGWSPHKITFLFKGVAKYFPI
jgi:hypothetical protein